MHKMVVWYREDSGGAHLAYSAPYKPACGEVSHPRHWWRVEGLGYEIEDQRLRELVSCPHCLQQIESD